VSLGAGDKRVLAIDPASRGFGFAVLEGPKRLIDWGVKSARVDKDKRCLKLIEDLIERYQPDVLVVEDYVAKGSRRCRRVQQLIAGILSLASKNRVKARSYSRRTVKKAFSQHDASNKQQIATAIANQLPELKPRVPPYRKPWMSEDERMSIFNAVALALTFFYKQKKAA
jgi:Holliday junction resolvasome RuvABC endonuclease subunit